ncbi:MAG: RNA polymerase sigma factor [Planctomycetes bacterium]|nr:RNA polymerase sigma factor [Planctomycetota bacterium]
MSASGDSHGWVLEAVELYELPLLRYARRLLGDVDLAADSVQHAFVKLCRESSDKLKGRVAPWLFRVCRNRALDHLRQSGRERSLLAADGDAPSGGARTPGSREADPAIACEQADLAERLRTLLADLPAPQRETIDLWCEGLCYREIAEITGRQEGHIRVLAHRGLTALRTHPLVRDLLTPAGLQSAQSILAS